MKSIECRIHGMSCASCDVRVARRVRTFDGVEGATVNHATGQARLQYSRAVTLGDVEAAIRPHDYTVSLCREAPGASAAMPVRKRSKNCAETGLVFVLLVVLYLLLKDAGLVPRGPGNLKDMSYGVIFLIGLVAATAAAALLVAGLTTRLATENLDDGAIHHCTCHRQHEVAAVDEAGDLLV